MKPTYSFDKIAVDSELTHILNETLWRDFMQFKRLAVALAASFPLFAAAQTSVTMYGIADAAVAVQNDGVSGRQTVVNSGNQSTSRLGFRGTEDLGNGLKAMFNLEAGVALDTGAADSALFGRRSVVGLEGGFGAVTVGREYSPIASVAAASDIFGQGFFGTNLSAFNAGRLTRRLSNSVNYKSAAMSGFKVLAAYSAGEKTPSPSGDLKGVAVEYANGALYLGGGYHTVQRLATGNDKEYGLGAGYKIGEVEIKGNWLVADLIGPNNKFTQYNLGAAMAFGPGKVYANVQQNKIENGARGNAYAVAYSYSLSRRTNLYTSFATMRNNGMATFGLNSAGTSLNPPATAIGADPKVFSVGVRHTF
jgi:predicted porin